MNNYFVESVDIKKKTHVAFVNFKNEIIIVEKNSKAFHFLKEKSELNLDSEFYGIHVPRRFFSDDKHNSSSELGSIWKKKDDEGNGECLFCFFTFSRFNGDPVICGNPTEVPFDARLNQNGRVHLKINQF